jgi:hypothetical protein
VGFWVRTPTDDNVFGCASYYVIVGELSTKNQFLGKNRRTGRTSGKRRCGFSCFQVQKFCTFLIGACPPLRFDVTYLSSSKLGVSMLQINILNLVSSVEVSGKRPSFEHCAEFISKASDFLYLNFKCVS